MERGTYEAMRRDMRALLDEHGFEEMSLTFTGSKKRTHGSLNFQRSDDGDEQTSIPGTRGRATGTTEQA